MFFQTVITHSLNLKLPFRWKPQDRLHEVVQASGVVLDLGGFGLLCCSPEHDWRLASSPIKKDQRGGEDYLITLLSITLERWELKGRPVAASCAHFVY